MKRLGWTWAASLALVACADGGAGLCIVPPAAPSTTVGGQIQIPASALDLGATTRFAFSAKAELALAELGGASLPGPVAQSDAQGRFALPGLPQDRAVVVTARVQRADGQEVQLKDLALPGPSGPESAPSAASTLALEALAQISAPGQGEGASGQAPGASPSGAPGAVARGLWAQAVAAVELHLASQGPVDWAQPASIQAAAQVALAQAPSLRATLQEVALALGLRVAVRWEGPPGAMGHAQPQAPRLPPGEVVEAEWVDPQGQGLQVPKLGGLAFDPEGRLYAVEPEAHRLWRLTSLGGARWEAEVLVGQGPGWVDGAPSEAKLLDPRDVAWDPTGGLVVAELQGQRLRRVRLQPEGPRVSTLAGDGVAGHADGPAATGRLDRPVAVAVAQDGEVLVAEGHGQVLRRISPDGMLSTLAGSPQQRGRADGLSASARFFAPQGLALAAQDLLVVSDSANHALRGVRWRQVDATTVATLAGSPPGQATEGLPGAPAFADGQGLAAAFSTPMGLASSSDGAHIYIADAGNRRIRRVNLADGLVTTVAGTGGRGRVGGPALGAQFDFPSRLALSREGLLAIVDANLRRLALLQLPSL